MRPDPTQAALADMFRAAGLILSFVRGRDLDALGDDLLLQSAVLHQLLVIGEAAKHVPMTFRHEHDNIPWSEITGMRDRLIHGYRDVDMDIVRETVGTFVPQLAEELENIIDE